MSCRFETEALEIGANVRSMQQLLQEGQAEKDELRKQLAAEKWTCRNLEQEVAFFTFDSPVVMPACRSGGNRWCGDTCTSAQHGQTSF